MKKALYYSFLSFFCNIFGLIGRSAHFPFLPSLSGSVSGTISSHHWDLGLFKGNKKSSNLLLETLI